MRYPAWHERPASFVAIAIRVCAASQAAFGYEIPLTGPLPFNNRLTFFFVKGF